MKKIFPYIETARLILRKPASADIAAIAQLANDYDIAKSTTNIPFPYSNSDAEFWINMALEGFENGNAFTFFIESKAENIFMGGIDLHLNKRFSRAEVGYWIGKMYWNKGYCSEALKAIMEFGFNQLNLNKIFATHFSENRASGRVMEKCGMIQEGNLVQHMQRDGKFKDLVQYRLTKGEYLKG